MSTGTRVLFLDARIASTTVPAVLPEDTRNDTTGAMRRIATHVHEHAEAYLPADEDGSQVVSVSVITAPDGGDDAAVGEVHLRDGAVIAFRLRRPPRNVAKPDA